MRRRDIAGGSSGGWLTAVRLALAGLVVAAALAATSMASAAWVCQPGECHWGYNYMGSGLNTPNNGPWNYWTVNFLDKNSGGTIQWGTGPVDGCVSNKTGVGTWSYLIPTGCGSPPGYSHGYLIWNIGYGASSYLYVRTTTGL